VQAASLSFIVAATAIGMKLGMLSSAIGATIVLAGLLSVLLLPLSAVTLLRTSEKPAMSGVRDDFDALRKPGGTI